MQYLTGLSSASLLVKSLSLSGGARVFDQGGGNSFSVAYQTSPMERLYGVPL